MRRLLCILLVVLVLLSIVPGVMAASGDTIVYVTRTGECYHKSGCSYLKSKIEVTLQYAVDNGYRACSRCHPPTLDSSTVSRSAPTAAPKTNNKSSGNSDAFTNWLDSVGSSNSVTPTPKTNNKSHSVMDTYNRVFSSATPAPTKKPKTTPKPKSTATPEPKRSSTENRKSSKAGWVVAAVLAVLLIRKKAKG